MAKALPWLILAMGAIFGLAVFVFGSSLPINQRVSGDAVGYLAIASRFRTLGDAFAFAGQRTYGFPLFIHCAFWARAALGVSGLVHWLSWLCGILFLIHLGACLWFYKFFLRGKFQKVGLPDGASAVAAAMLMAFPALVSHTTIPLTDTFSVDLLMIAAGLLSMAKGSLHPLALPQSTLCGLLLGYAVMVRPSFWPAVAAFFACDFLGALRASNRQRLISAVALAGMLAVILPALETGRSAFGTPCLQSPEFVKSSSAGCMQAGLSAVRVFWSAKKGSDQEPLPGVRDPYLAKKFKDTKSIESLGGLLAYLSTSPLASLLYFGKKLIALFDEPYLQPYAVDQTPNWFTLAQRVFEVAAFCGFSAMLFWIVAGPLLKLEWELLPLPWIGLVMVLLLTHSIMHIEGRFGFAVIPFSIAALFLGYGQARKAGGRVFIAWSGTMILAAIVFVWQVLAWDRLVT